MLLGMFRRRGGVGGGGPAFSPWSVGSLPADVTSANGGFRLLRSGGSNFGRIVSHPLSRSSGKFALRFGARSTSGAAAIGFRNAAAGSYLGANTTSWAFWIDNSGSTDQAFHNGSGTTLTGLGNVGSGSDSEIMMEVDIDAGRVWFGLNGTWASSGNPGAGTGAIYTNLSGSLILCADMYYNLSELELRTPSQFVTAASSGFTPGWPD